MKRTKHVKPTKKPYFSKEAQKVKRRCRRMRSLLLDLREEGFADKLVAY